MATGHAHAHCFNDTPSRDGVGTVLAGGQLSFTFELHYAKAKSPEATPHKVPVMVFSHEDRDTPVIDLHNDKVVSLGDIYIRQIRVLPDHSRLQGA